MFFSSILPAQASVERLALNNGTINLELTPDIGGRILAVNLQNQPNFLRVGDAVSAEPNPQVTAAANNIGYLGHEIWVGPQSEWWMHQLLNDERRKAKAVWPPDPFLILAKNTVQETSPKKIILRSPNSPVSGVAINKTFSLIAEKPNHIQLDVTATNIRDTQVAWDIWFNTRVPHTANVYVPVADMSDVRIENFTDATYGPLAHNFSDGFFALENSASSAHMGRKGKIFIQPAQGWMATFRDQQVFIIQFPLQPKSAIHSAQGQIELYQEFLNAEMGSGLLELEVHAPYRKLESKESMTATETWMLLPNTAGVDPQAQRALLRNLIKTGLLK
jgi:hypothetical protein